MKIRLDTIFLFIAAIVVSSYPGMPYATEVVDNLSQRVSDGVRKEQPVDILRTLAANNPRINSSAGVRDLLVSDIDSSLVRIFAIRVDAQAMDVQPENFIFEPGEGSKVLDWASGVDAGGTIWRIGFLPRNNNEVYAVCVVKQPYSSQYTMRGVWKLVPKHWNK